MNIKELSFKMIHKQKTFISPVFFSLTNQMIISKSTAVELFSKWKKNESFLKLLLPCDFNRSKREFFIKEKEIHFQNVKIPKDLFEECKQENVSFLINEFKIEILQKKTENNVNVKICEPNLEKDFKGGILQIGNMKMHISKGFKDSFEFSKKLAQNVNFYIFKTLFRQSKE
jgi:hypothetical protein